MNNSRNFESGASCGRTQREVRERVDIFVAVRAAAFTRSYLVRCFSLIVVVVVIVVAAVVVVVTL